MDAKGDDVREENKYKIFVVVSDLFVARVVMSELDVVEENEIER